MRILRGEFFMCLFKHKQLICVIFVLLDRANVFLFVVSVHGIFSGGQSID